MADDAKICEVGGGGLVLPLGGDGEQEWPNALRVILYLLGLGWCFMGVAIIADVFMGAIEAVTSKKKRVKVKGTNRFVTVKVWNDTVANLTLMALGSSAPEILLSVIELLGASFYAGALGPSTIVGSAAFNLFCISAVCVMAIENGEVRIIKDTSVFTVTASFSVFAYLWLVVILMLITPDIVDVWEGLLSFLFFPILVVIAYLADIGKFSGVRKDVVQNKVTAAEMSKEELAAMVLKIRQQYGSELTDEQAVRLVERETAQPKSRAEYRIAATRGMAGGRRVSVCSDQGTVEKIDHTSDDATSKATSKAVIGFEAAKYAVLESAGSITINVERKGDTSTLVMIDYKTKDGTANAETDFIPLEGTLEFQPGDTVKPITITIIDDTAYELDEDFYLELSNPRCSESEKDPKVAALGEHDLATITIIDDDEPGVLSFQSEAVHIMEDVQEKVMTIMVDRKNGSKGAISCKYYTENDSAIAGPDYDHVEGELEFADQQMTAEIEINIKAKGRYEKSELFRLFLTEPTGGAKFDGSTDGGDDECILSIIIEADEKDKKKLDAVDSLLKLNWDKARVGHANYKGQFVEALYVNGSPEEQAEASMSDKVMHCISLPWKLFFALVPPVDYGGGWVCFNVALIFIGGVTAIIGDMASLLGCCMGVPDAITAITFVALGTSLPDTFASKTAATQDPYADAAIGNVTGSNAVNVFLGLGLPWFMGACYWSAEGPTSDWKARYPDLASKYPDGGFAVPAGDLGFSVIVFCTLAVSTIGLLCLRRKVCGGELGGPDGPKKASAALMVTFWFTYVAMSSWKTMDSLNKS